MQTDPSSRVPLLLSLVAATLFASCSSGGGQVSSFGIDSINMKANATWEINRPIKITFTEPVDFSTVNLNTINIRALNGGPSAGEFYMEGTNTVVFQPRCPTLDDLSDAGLAPGGKAYEMTVLGIDKAAPLTVKSTSGSGLSVGDTRNFVTPDSTLALDLFYDSKVGPPVPIVRNNQPSDMNMQACYIELAGDPDNRVYFRVDSSGQGMLDPLQTLPLNRLSELNESVALVLYFNQAVNPSNLNVNSERLSWQFDASVTGGAPDWTILTTNVELVANCTQTGALVRITPRGILPPNTALRVVVSPDFSDIVGQTNLLTQATFALADTDAAPAAPDPLPDQFIDQYASYTDIDTISGFPEPPAVVKDGKLSASFSFTGTGGINGEFDWKIPAGAAFIFNTDSQLITGGPNFISQTTVTVIGGVVDLRNMRIEAGATLKVQGSKPLTILASGFVEILGTLDISGTDSKGVVTLNSTNVPESGAPGQGGGGRGGNGSPLVTSSSPKGGNGSGAFNVPDGGGVGGETGWNNVSPSQIDGRRGAGGGGGTFGSNQAQTGAPGLGVWDQAFIGLDGEPGFPNLAAPPQIHNGASTGSLGPLGGPVGPSPFGDFSSVNNFYGLALVSSVVIPGELKKPWAGAGGGGGGDSAYVGQNLTFPMIPFDPKGDEKGGGGGGGGGSLQIMALGSIVFGLNGTIVCRGGSGGGGENTSGTNRVGAAGGGGSGGHVILQTAGAIDMSISAGTQTGGVMSGGILATGGQGGAGKNDVGGAKLGANGKFDTLPQFDACPPTYPTAGTNACKGHIDSAGGDGGPGLIQLHAPNGLASVLLPAGKTLNDLCKPKPLFADGSGQLLPSFGRLSRIQSDWIALGEGGFDKSVGSPYRDVVLSLGGTDILTGKVLDDGSGMVQQLPPILGPNPPLTSSGVPSIQSDRRLVINAAPLVSNPDYGFLLSDPNQFEHFLLRLTFGATVENFDVSVATYDALSQVLTLDVSESGPPLTGSFGPGSTAELLPAFFRVYSDSTPDALPATSSITISMQATTADSLTGLPDPGSQTLFVTDAEDLNLDPSNADFRFVRYQVLFDMAASGGALTPDNPIPSIDFLRLPFRYQ